MTTVTQRVESDAGLRRRIVHAVRRPASKPALLASAVAALAACDSSTAPPPEPPPELEINTIAITVSGGDIELDTTVEAIAGFQYITGGEPAGLHIQAEPEGLPFAIHLPSVPSATAATLGRWDPRADFVRVDTIPIFLGSTPRISFGSHPAAALNYYSSLDGVVELDSVSLPEYREFGDRGRVRGRVQARAAADSLLLPPGSVVQPDTVDITAEFFVEVQGWHNGRASAEFTDGALAGRAAPEMYGSGNAYYVGGFPQAEDDPQLVVLLIGRFSDNQDRVYIWFGTKLRGPGEAEIETMDIDSIFLSREWPHHFVAGLIVPNESPAGQLWVDGRPLVAVSGVLELDAYEEVVFRGAEDGRWGDAEGRLLVELDFKGESGEIERTRADIDFHVPSYWIVSVESGPPGPAARNHVGRQPRSSVVSIP